MDAAAVMDAAVAAAGGGPRYAPWNHPTRVHGSHGTVLGTPTPYPADATVADGADMPGLRWPCGDIPTCFRILAAV